MSRKRQASPEPHPTIRTRRILDGLIVVVLISILGTGLVYRNLSAGKARLLRRLHDTVDTRNNGSAAETIQRYRLPDGRDVIGVLNETLDSIGLSGVVMEMVPGAASEPVPDGTRGYPVHLRLAPVPAGRIAEMMNAFEFREPRLMIVSLQMTRIRSGDDAVDVTLELMGFR